MTKHKYVPKTYEEMENADYEPEVKSNKNGLVNLYEEMFLAGVPIDECGQIYLGDGLVLNSDGEVDEL